MTLMEVALLVIMICLVILAILALVAFYFLGRALWRVRRVGKYVKAEWVVTQLLMLSFLRPLARRLNRFKKLF